MVVLPKDFHSPAKGGHYFAIPGANVWINPLKLLLIGFAALIAATCSADDFFLTIGGGYAPSGNQASLERNVQFMQRLLREKQLSQRPTSIFLPMATTQERICK